MKLLRTLLGLALACLGFVSCTFFFIMAGKCER